MPNRGSVLSGRSIQNPGFRLKSTRRLADRRIAEVFFKNFSSPGRSIPRGRLSKVPIKQNQVYLFAPNPIRFASLVAAVNHESIASLRVELTVLVLTLVRFGVRRWRELRRIVILARDFRLAGSPPNPRRAFFVNGVAGGARRISAVLGDRGRRSSQMPAYHPQRIEPKWQLEWERNKTFRAIDLDPSRPKLYILDMFPYPSGAGLHVGPPGGIYRHRYLSAATSGCADSTCCIRWAGTPTVCRPSNTPS